MSQPRRRTEEQVSYENAKLHYESLASYLKYVVGIAGTLITVIAIVALSFTYSDRQSMKADVDKIKTDYEGKMLEIRTEAKETATKIKEDAKSDLQSVKDEANNNLHNVKENSRNELERIQSETHRIALDQTDKQIADIFKSDKIQAIIEKNAIGELKDKLPSTIADYTKRLPNIMEASNVMKSGSSEGVTMLKGYFNSPSEFERQFSKELYEQNMDDFRKYCSETSLEECLKILKMNNLALSDIHKMVDNNYPNDKADIVNITKLMDALNSPQFDNEYGLFKVGLVIKTLSYMSGKQFELFDRESINTWYKGLKK